ncbi:MAG: flagellar hook-associated protein FlgK [Gammaproteobacteria bacterium SHHR-1]|uniref:flagellar hook-associated protein FlgK n=1 Tax=Magnetovirga frankeli TaxID=947516 RepID=UPI001293BBD1|nr:flagellar hook-associated protein FlgK [gamma proteobacterium SS-5]
MPDALGIGVTGLKAFQTSLSTVSHNIANVNTEGYSRQEVPLVSGPPTNQGGRWSGSGVRDEQGIRRFEEFTASQVTTGYTVTEELYTYARYAERIDNMYADPEVGMGPVLQNFFDSLQTLSADSGSPAARELVLSDAENLAERFNELNTQTEAVRDQVNDAIRVAIDDLQGYADALAEVNETIAFVSAQNGGVTPPDLLDQRDKIINDAAKLTQVSTVLQDDGSLSLFVGNGVPLVVGATPSIIGARVSEADPGGLDITIKTSPNATEQVVTRQMTGGSIGGLERFRTEILDDAQNQLGLVAMGVAEQINEQHKLGVDLYGNFGQDFFRPMQGVALANDNNNTASGSFTVGIEDTNHLTGDEFRLTFDGTDYALRRLSDSKVIFNGNPLPTGEIMDGTDPLGFSLTQTGGLAAGDSFLIRPTRNGAQDIRLNLHDTNLVAAAAPVVGEPNGDIANLGSGLMSQPVLSARDETLHAPLSSWPAGVQLVLEFDNSAPGNPGFSVSALDAAGNPVPAVLTPPVTVPPIAATPFVSYDPATDSGSTLNIQTSIGELSFTMKGTPAYDGAAIPPAGDSFNIDLNLDANGNAPIADNRNAVLMAEMNNTQTMLDGNATFTGTFSRAVASVGTNVRQAEIAYTAQEGLLQQAKSAHAEVSGVNLDEEAAKMMRFQQAYQAAAQIITVARSLFDTLIGAVR